MQKTISTVPFSETPEQAEKLDEAINRLKDEKGSLVQVLQQAQGIYGYLPLEVQIRVANGLNEPLEKVYGVATFYSQFNLSPKGKYQISVCLGTACYVKNAKPILDKICEILGIGPEECTPDGKFSVTACRCIGACGLAPVITVNEDVYGRLEVKDIPAIIDKYKEFDSHDQH